MTTELTVYDGNQFPALVDGSDLREAMEANMQGQGFAEGDLVHVPTPSAGGTKWIVPGVAGEEMVDELTGVLVYFSARGTLWPTEDMTEGQMPLLVTNDLVKARLIGSDSGDIDYGDIDPEELAKYRNDDGTYRWMDLPWNQWGSGKKGIGKRCKESRVMMILREGEAFPTVVRAQPGSLKTIRPFIMRLTVPHFRAVISLSLRAEKSKGNQTYSQIVPKLIGTIDRETGEKMKEMYTLPLTKMAESVMAGDSE